MEGVYSAVDGLRSDISAFSASPALWPNMPVMLYATDENEIITDVSEYFCETLGYSRKELIGRRCIELFTEAAAARQSEALSELIRTGSCRNVSCEVRTKSGKVLDVLLSSITEYDESGVFLRCLTHVADVTDLRVGERALKYRSAFQDLITGISTRLMAVNVESLDREIDEALQAVGEYAGVDRSYLFEVLPTGRMSNTHEWCRSGIRPQMQDLQDIDLPSQFKWAAAVLMRLDNWVLRSVRDLPPEAHAERKVLNEGNICSLACVPLVYAEQFRGFIGFDVCSGEKDWKPDTIGLLRLVGELLANALERRRVEREHQSLNAMLSEARRVQSLSVFSGGVAHDLNNLLVGILGNVLLLQRENNLPPEAARRLDEVLKAGNRAAELGRQLLAYSGKGHFIKAPGELSSIVRDVLPCLRDGLSAKVKLELHLGENLPQAELDHRQVKQMMWYLVKNSAEAIGEADGTVHLSTYETFIAAPGSIRQAAAFKPGRYLVLEVSDTGCGMDAQTKERIFDPFFSTKFAGRGLGLAAVDGIVRGHAGAIEVDSGPGTGTVFRIFFPAGEEKPASRSTEMKTAKMKVLVIDDEELVLDVTRGMLEQIGCSVVTESDGARAIETLDEYGDLSAVILDVTMPVMSGEVVLQELRRKHPHLKVLLSSGYAESEALKRIGSDPNTGFIQKPFSFDRLNEALEELMNG